LIEGIEAPCRTPGHGYAFREFGRRHGDFAIVACAAEATLKGDGSLATLSFGLGGVESRPVIANTEAFLGKRADAALAAQIASAAAKAAAPMSDFKATADYRRALIEAIGAQVLTEAFNKARKT